MKEMPLEEHLEELRKRVLRITGIVALTFFVTYAFGGALTELLLGPLRGVVDKFTGKIIYLGVLDKVLSQLQLAFWSSIILSSPLWFMEIWFFVKPGLYEHERKMVRPFLVFGLVLFFLGVAFGHFLVIPSGLQILMHFGVSDVDAYFSLKDYINLSVKVLVFLGLAFQVPNAILILGMMGVVTKYSLRGMRRYVYFGLAATSAMITPPDVLTMLGIWIPLVGLFELGILLVSLIVHPYLARVHAP